MNRHQNWTDKPVTWRGYFKIAGIFGAIGTVVTAVSCVLLMEPAWWQVTKDFAKRLFKR